MSRCYLAARSTLFAVLFAGYAIVALRMISELNEDRVDLDDIVGTVILAAGMVVSAILAPLAASDAVKHFLALRAERRSGGRDA